MDSRERVLRSFDHKETDRPPVDFGGTVVTCMTRSAHRKLKALVGIADAHDPIIDYTMGTVEPCDELKLMFGSDFRRVALNYAPPDITDDTYVDGFGITLKRAAPHEYYDVVHSPLRDACVADLDHMRMPDPDNPALYHGLKDRAADLSENTPYAVVADFGVPGFYETSQKLRGYEQLACDLLINEDFVRALYDRLLALQKRFFRNYLDQVGRHVQVVGYADDLGMQDRPQMSPETYRKIIKPYHRQVFACIHEHTDAKILLHCCGAIYPLIDDLIDAGIDILNPIQPRAKDMEPERLKRAFGDRLVFWGGFDEQYVLPKAPPDRIRAEAARLMKVLGKDGGYVFAVSHNIQNDTPPENVVALFEAARDYGRS